MTTFNRWAYTLKTLKNLLAYTDSAVEVIIVDNGSTDNTPEKLYKFLETEQKSKKAACPSFKIIVNDKNLGIGRAVNQVFSASTRPLLIKLDNDILVQKDWLYYLWSSYKFYGQKFGVCCLEVRDLEGNPEIPQSGTRGKVVPIFSDVLFEHTSVVNGTPMAIARHFWKSFKFPEDRLYGHEDARLASEAWTRGLACGQIRSPESWVVHLQHDNSYRKYDLWKLHTASTNDYSFRKDVSCLPLEGDKIVAKIERENA